MKNLRVVSLFDGISCGRLALERAGFNTTSYEAYEIEPHAIEVSKKNYPDIIHLECERLQTLPDNYTLIEDGRSLPQSDRYRYEMIGNGWTVDVVAHIFRGMSL